MGIIFDHYGTIAIWGQFSKYGFSCMTICWLAISINVHMIQIFYHITYRFLSHNILLKYPNFQVIFLCKLIFHPRKKIFSIIMFKISVCNKMHTNSSIAPKCNINKNLKPRLKTRCLKVASNSEALWFAKLLNFTLSRS